MDLKPMSTKRKFTLRSVSFRAWELEFLVKAAEMKHGHDCLEYIVPQDIAVQRLIKKLKNNAEKQEAKENNQA
jgi:hypothetical protein